MEDPALGTGLIVVRAFVATLLVSGLLTACGSESVVPPSEPDTASSVELPSSDAAIKDLGWGLGGLEGVDEFGHITDISLLTESAEKLGLSDEQIAAMSDGTVTFAEHERLTRLALSCMEARGLDARELGLKQTQQGVEQVRYAFSGDAAGYGDKQTLEIASFCEQLHMVPATLIYGAEFGISIEEEQGNINEAFIRYGQCLRDAGITDIPSVDNYDPLMQDELLTFLDDPRHDCTLEIETP